MCSEEILEEIVQRYLRYNSHAASYTWKHNHLNLDMTKTLCENGIIDEDEDFYQCRMDHDLHTESICLYFNDDLTEFWPTDYIAGKYSMCTKWKQVTIIKIRSP